MEYEKLMDFFPLQGKRESIDGNYFLTFSPLFSRNLFWGFVYGLLGGRNPKCLPNEAA